MKICLLASSLALVMSCSAFAVEPIEWRSKPIKIPLQVGEQRLIHFPDHVVFGRPRSLADKLDADSMQGTLYLTAQEEFAPTQVKVKLNDSGDIVLLELVAVPRAGAPLDEVLISVPGSEAGTGVVAEAGSGTGADSQKSAPVVENPLAGTPFDTSGDAAISPEEMIQFAAREFYAPPRLRTNEPRLNRTALNSAEDMRDLFIDTSYGIFDVTPIAAWQSTSGQYLTAIKLVNRKSAPVKVNPFHLNMQYAYAAAQHIQLNQNNVPGDTTMLYVISDRPFSDSRYESPAPWAPVASSQPAVNQYHRQGSNK